VACLRRLRPQPPTTLPLPARNVPRVFALYCCQVGCSWAPAARTNVYYNAIPNPELLPRAQDKDTPLIFLHPARLVQMKRITCVGSTLVAVWDNYVSGLGQYVFVGGEFHPRRTPGERFAAKAGNGRSVPIPTTGG